MEHKKFSISDVDVYLSNTSKFKTKSISICYTTAFDPSILSDLAILAKLLIKTNSIYKTEKDFNYYLQTIYDTTVFATTITRGNTISLLLSVTFIDESFLEENIDLVKEVTKLINVILNKPNLENNKFNNELIEREKQILTEEIHSSYGNKNKYASLQFNNAMFKDEIAKYSNVGDIESVEKVNQESIIQVYKNLLSGNKEIYVSGNITQDKIVDCITSNLKITSIKEQFNYLDYSTKQISKVQEVIENNDTNQSILFMGYRIPVKLQDSDYYAALLFNEMLGECYPSSLFTEIREKNSMAYYIGSNFLNRNGVIIINAGISANNYSFVTNAVAKIISDYNKGKISEEKLQNVKVNMINKLTEDGDHIIDLLYRNLNISEGRPQKTFEEKIERVKSVTKKDIMNVSKKMKLDTIYLLKGNSNPNVVEESVDDDYE